MGIHPFSTSRGESMTCPTIRGSGSPDGWMVGWLSEIIGRNHQAPIVFLLELEFLAKKTITGWWFFATPEKTCSNHQIMSNHIYLDQIPPENQIPPETSHTAGFLGIQKAEGVGDFHRDQPPQKLLPKCGCFSHQNHSKEQHRMGI